MTINELMCLKKEVSQRMRDLQDVRSQVAVTERRFYGGDERKEIEPKYDVKAVDLKIVELQTFQFKSDSAIKQSNATTAVVVEGGVDVNSLLAPLV